MLAMLQARAKTSGWDAMGELLHAVKGFQKLAIEL